MHIFYRTTLQCDHSISPTLSYIKLAFIWGFIFESSVISNNDFISDSVVVVKSFTIFADIIFINLRLISLTH